MLNVNYNVMGDMLVISVNGKYQFCCKGNVGMYYMGTFENGKLIRKKTNLVRLPKENEDDYDAYELHLLGRGDAYHLVGVENEYSVGYYLANNENFEMFCENMDGNLHYEAHLRILDHIIDVKYTTIETEQGYFIQNDATLDVFEEMQY